MLNNVSPIQTIMGNTTHEQNGSSLLVFGFLRIPATYSTEKDFVMGLIALMSVVGIIANGILLLVIIKDPFKQFRTITAILLAFNAVTNLSSCLVFILDNIFHWSGEILSAQLILSISTFVSLLYIIGNLLQTINTYGAIVHPVSYSIFAPKIRKISVQCLVLTWIVILLVVMIPFYTIPLEKFSSFFNGMSTVICILLVLLVITFGYLYTKIFKDLYTRKRRLTLSFHLKQATVRGRAINKKNHDIVKTLFIHVSFFMIVSIPGSIVFLIFLQCTTCDPVKLQLVTLFTVPISFTPVLFLPLLWLIRLKQYKKATIKILNFWKRESFWRRKSKTVNVQGSSLNLVNNARSGSCTKELQTDIVSLAV